MKLIYDLTETPSVVAKHKKNNKVQLCKKTVDIGFYSKPVRNVCILDKKTNSTITPNKEFVCIETNNKVVDKNKIFTTFAYWLYRQKRDKSCTNRNIFGRYIVECEI